MFQLRIFIFESASSNTNYKKYNCENCNFIRHASTEKKKANYSERCNDKVL